MWSLGDYPRVAELLEPGAKALADACAIGPGVSVLDIAAGNGNFSLAAARRGAVVTATDITPKMVELGRARTGAAGLSVEWSEADAEKLPFADASYDTNAPQAALKAMMPPETYQKVLDAKKLLIEELNESTDGRVKLSSPYILVLARRPK